MYVVAVRPASTIRLRDSATCMRCFTTTFIIWKLSICWQAVLIDLCFETFSIFGLCCVTCSKFTTILRQMFAFFELCSVITLVWLFACISLPFCLQIKFMNGCKYFNFFSRRNMYSTVVPVRYFRDSLYCSFQECCEVQDVYWTILNMAASWRVRLHSRVSD